MSIIHMDIEATLQCAKLLDQICADGQHLIENTASNLRGMDWSGPSRENFMGEVERLKASFERTMQSGMDLSLRVSREVAEWQSADDGTKYADVLPVITPDPSPVDDGGDFGEVLGAVDTNGNLSDKPGLVDWLKQVFDVIKSIFGRESAKGIFAKLLQGLDTLFKGGELAKSSSDIQRLSDKYIEMMNQYGTSDPRTLAARREYSGAEMEQLFSVSGIPVDFFAKLGGKWEALIDSYEQAKYEGPDLFDGMNYFNPPSVE
jgi:hypothetical protein